MKPTYADRLMKMASDVESEADRLLALNAASGIDAQLITEKVAFYRGQASGYRQSAYWMTIVEGTIAHD